MAFQFRRDHVVGTPVRHRCLKRQLSAARDPGSLGRNWSQFGVMPTAESVASTS
jgi:hypothetical protein